MTFFADLVSASDEVAKTSSRSNKVGLLAELLRRLDPDEVPIAVGFLSGLPRQGRIGVGYATSYGVAPDSAKSPSLTIVDIDRAIDAIQRTTGAGSATGRREILGDVFGKAT